MHEAEIPLVKKVPKHLNGNENIVCWFFILLLGLLSCTFILHFYGPDLLSVLPAPLPLLTNEELAQASQNPLLYVPVDGDVKVDGKTLNAIKLFYERNDINLHKGVDAVYATVNFPASTDSPDFREAKVWYRSMPIQQYESLLKENKLSFTNDKTFGALTNDYKYVTSFSQDSGIESKESVANNVIIVTAFTLPQSFFKLVSDEHAILHTKGNPPEPKTEFGAHVYGLGNAGQSFKFQAKLGKEEESDFTASLGYLFQDLLDKEDVKFDIVGMYMPIDKAGQFAHFFDPKTSERTNSRRKI